MCHNHRVPRTYRLKRRADRQEETKQRIVAAAVSLHQELGPARTSISAVAERAGVQRHTFYRYFPEEADLLRACSAHYRSLHPPPDPGTWRAIADPARRLRTGLAAAYAYFRANEAMMANVLRDAEVMPVGGGFLQLRRAMTDALLSAWRVGGRRRERLHAAIGLAVSFQTWHALARDYRLDDHETAELVATMVLCAAAPRPATRRPQHTG